MPLLDHFHAPLVPTYAWESFHSSWATFIARWLNHYLPREQFLAQTQIHLGRNVEADIVEFERAAAQREDNRVTGNGEGGVAVQPWAPPLTSLVMPATFPDNIEIQITENRGGLVHLVGVIELVSPGNLDRPDARRAFAMKCGAYLQRGIGLVIVDIVTSAQFNLHNELVEMTEAEERLLMPAEQHLYATSYSPVHREGRNEIDLWLHPLTLNEPLPVSPLLLRGGPAVPLDLEASYAEARDACNL